MIDINLKGYFLCAQRAIKHFLERPEGPEGGVVVFDSSVHQIIPKPTYAGYACSKAAIGHLTSTLGLEYAGRGIRVNSVAPGAIATPMNAVTSVSFLCGFGESSFTRCDYIAGLDR